MLPPQIFDPLLALTSIREDHVTALIEANIAETQAYIEKRNKESEAWVTAKRSELTVLQHLRDAITVCRLHLVVSPSAPLLQASTEPETPSLPSMDSPPVTAAAPESPHTRDGVKPPVKKPVKPRGPYGPRKKKPQDPPPRHHADVRPAQPVPAESVLGQILEYYRVAGNATVNACSRSVGMSVGTVEQVIQNHPEHFMRVGIGMYQRRKQTAP